VPLPGDDERWPQEVTVAPIVAGAKLAVVQVR
jgi:hypothetical protein